MAVCNADAVAAPRRVCGQDSDRDLFERLARDGDAQARAALIERSMPLARSVALRYHRSHEPFEDLLQVAAVGLIKAVDRFDPERGVAFSSYAVPTILGELRRHFRDRTWAARVPRDLQELSLRIDRAVWELGETLQRQPSVAEVGAALRIGEESVLEALQARGAHRALSFDAPCGTGEGPATLADVIGFHDRGFDRAESRATMNALLVILTARERDILRLRFEDELTQAEIGATLGISQMQVSRLIRRSLARLQAVGSAWGGRPAFSDGGYSPRRPPAGLGSAQARAADGSVQ
jgi:RNA polymerase sigma-B factor